MKRITATPSHQPLHLQIADTTIVNIYAELVVRWPYGLLCTMVTVGLQERQTLKCSC